MNQEFSIYVKQFTFDFFSYLQLNNHIYHDTMNPLFSIVQANAIETSIRALARPSSNGRQNTDSNDITDFFPFI